MNKFFSFWQNFLQKTLSTILNTLANTWSHFYNYNNHKLNASHTVAATMEFEYATGYLQKPANARLTSQVWDYMLSNCAMKSYNITLVRGTMLAPTKLVEEEELSWYYDVNSKLGTGSDELISQTLKELDEKTSDKDCDANRFTLLCGYVLPSLVWVEKHADPAIAATTKNLIQKLINSNTELYAGHYEQAVKEREDANVETFKPVPHLEWASINYNDLNEGIVDIGCTGCIGRRIAAMRKLFDQFVKQPWREHFLEPFVLVTSGGRVDIVYPFNSVSKSGYYIEFNLRANTQWWSDYTYNYWSHHTNDPTIGPGPGQDEEVEDYESDGETGETGDKERQH